MDAPRRANVGKRSQIPCIWPYLILCAFAAVWIDLGTLHSGHNGDSLIPVLVSLQRWTPFFWEQDRIGMLVPLIAAPFRNPLVNFLLQGFFYVFSYLAAAFLLARYILRGASYPFLGALSASAFLSLATAHYRFGFFL